MAEKISDTEDHTGLRPDPDTPFLPDGAPGATASSASSASDLTSDPTSAPTSASAPASDNGARSDGTSSSATGARRPRRPRLHLPFERRKSDAGTWAYDHRMGLCVTLIAYLVLMIVFVSSKIVVGRRASQQGMYIDLQELTALEEERDRLQEELERSRREEIDWRSIRNEASNENASDERLRDDRGTNTAALNDAAAAAAAQMAANREAYEAGLAEERAIRERRGRSEGEERRDRKVKGRVTVSFSLVDPVRTSRWLEVPAYLCEGGGEVVVTITVDRGGRVVGARVERGGDECMRDAALRAARGSEFNIDESAPARQTGTITYLFIPQ